MEKSPRFELKTKLSPERQSEMIEKFKDMGFSLEDDGQHFVARVEVDGKETARYFPKWETMDLEHGGTVKTADDIEAFFRFGPGFSTLDGMEKLKKYRNSTEDRR